MESQWVDVVVTVEMEGERSECHSMAELTPEMVDAFYSLKRELHDNAAGAVWTLAAEAMLARAQTGRALATTQTLISGDAFFEDTAKSIGRRARRHRV